MEFIGEKSQAAPRLKDAQGLGNEEYSNIYLQLLQHMRTLFQDC